MTSDKKNTLEDFRISVKIKLSALWTTVMFCYVYGDFFLLFVPGHIKDLMEGKSGAGNTTPLSLLSYGILMTLPILMIILSLVLKPVANRRLNIIFGILFTLIMALIAVTSIDKWLLNYVYFACVEIVLTSLVVWLAWKWPRETAH